jgi:hypothetical protein
MFGVGEPIRSGGRYLNVQAFTLQYRSHFCERLPEATKSNLNSRQPRNPR